MDTGLLRDLLSAGLLDIGDDTDKFSSLEKASSELIRLFRKNRKILMRATSWAIGYSWPEEEVTESCDAAIAKSWPLYKVRFPNGTTEVFRIIILQAISTVANDDTDCAGIVYYTGANLLAVKPTDKSTLVLDRFISSLAAEVDNKALQAWGFSDAQATIPALPKPNPNIPKLDTKLLSSGLKEAAGPTGSESSNPFWPSEDNNWLDFYGKRSAEVINDAMLMLWKQATMNCIDISRNDTKILIEGSIGGLARLQAGQNHRTNILFWKEALYSRSKNSSYRSLPEIERAFWAAIDLHFNIPSLHLHSIEHFLRETLRAANDHKSLEKVAIASICETFREGIIPKSYDSAFPDNERITLFQFLVAFSNNRFDLSHLRDRVGVDAETALATDDFAVWILRDLQVMDLLNVKVKGDTK